MKLSLRYSLLVAAILGSAAGCTATVSSTEVDIPYDAMKELVKAGSALQLTVIRQEESHRYYRKRLFKQYSELMDQVDAVQAWAEAIAGPDVVARCAAGEVNEVETIVGDVEEGSAAVEVEITVAETVKVEHEKKCPCCVPKEDRKEDSTDEDICNRDLKTEDAKVVDKDSKDKDADEEINKAEADHVHSTSDESDAKESTSKSDEPHKKCEDQCEPEGCCGKEAPKDNEETREDEENHIDKVHEKSDGKEDNGDGEVKETKTDDDATEKNSTEEPARENDSTEEKSKNDKETVAEKEEHEEKSNKTKKKEKKKEKKNGKSRQSDDSDDSEDEAADKGDREADIANEEDASKKPTEDASKKPTEDAEKEKVAPAIKSETGESALEQELKAENLDKVVADQDSMASFNKPTAMTMIVGILSLGSVAVLY